MKNRWFLFGFLSAAVLSSCLDTEEKIVLNADNSGTYSVSIDLGRMLKMAGSMGADKSNPDKVKEKKDTTVYLKDLVDSADNLTDAEKALYKDGMIKVNLDEEKNEMKIVMSSPFKNAAALTEIKNNFFTVMNKLKAFEKATGEKEKPDEENDDMKLGTKSANPVGDQFTFKAEAGSISNTITNIDSFKNLVASDSTLGMMSKMTSMMGDFNYRTIIVLPKAVKKYDGPGSTVSADKKTITFFTTLAEMMEHPEKASYNVDY
ncbi:MAG: hypothetical protein ABI707_04915 [Ferruginibacter sp.]